MEPWYAANSGSPVPQRHSPLPGDELGRQVHDLEDGIVVGEDSVIPAGFPQGHVDRLNRIGRVDDLADVCRKSEHREAGRSTDQVPYIGLTSRLGDWGSAMNQFSVNQDW